MDLGLFRLAVFSPELRLGDCEFNSKKIATLLATAEKNHAGLALFPELSLTGYTCADLFHQSTLLHAATQALEDLRQESAKNYSGIVIVGLPLEADGKLFNCAVVIHQGKILGAAPKSHLPNYKEFYERRYFSPARDLTSCEIFLNGISFPIGPGLLFQARDYPKLKIGIEICEDLWVPVPPSSNQAMAGASLLVNLSASNELVGKALYRKSLILNQSGRCRAAYAYASSGVKESTTDLVFGGHCLVAECGQLIGENQRFSRHDSTLIADVDLERVQLDRISGNSWGEMPCLPVPCHTIYFNLNGSGLVSQGEEKIHRVVDAHPFVPKDSTQLHERCEEIFQIQVAGLARRLEQVGDIPATLGVSGGLDSTLALLVACKAFKALQRPLSNFLPMTMPGFGTTARTLGNARKLMSALGLQSKEIDIRALCFQEWLDLGHNPFGISLENISLQDFQTQLQAIPKDRKHDLVFENVQARRRTALLMNQGFVIGTGDLSELALGWCTFNADHMAMYNPNASIPKSLVRFLIEWVADQQFEDPIRGILHDIAQTPISPELLPTGPGLDEIQSTEDAIGPYELHDFFLYHLVRMGFSPGKIAFLAKQTKFHKSYSVKEIEHWLDLFISRFFASQFKRSSLPDGPKVGTVSLSPRGDWRMPSDLPPQRWPK
ncbi:MAG: NAD(+) synthase [Gemmataceae bacterium]|nr:NAD(+) synthase [Gemmataceae bacterium]